YQFQSYFLSVIALSPSSCYPLSLHDALPILEMFNEDYVTFPRDDIAKLSGLTMPVNKRNFQKQADHLEIARAIRDIKAKQQGKRSEEHTSELQSRFDLVCRLLLEKKNTKKKQ